MPDSAVMANRPVSFALHIAPLFTEDQVACMATMIDLVSYEEMRSSAEAVHEKLFDKSMPPDASGPWPDEWIALFRRWIDEGCAP